jgi:hypothetical protein
MNRPARIAAVTTGLAGAGAACGAAAGSLALSISLSIDGPASLGVVLFFGGAFGAVLGAVTAPILAWSLLRRVALGRMFAGCTLGTVVGGVVGWVTTPGAGDVMVSGLSGALIGCVVAAISLRRLEA